MFIWSNHSNWSSSSNMCVRVNSTSSICSSDDQWSLCFLCCWSVGKFCDFFSVWPAETVNDLWCDKFLLGFYGFPYIFYMLVWHNFKINRSMSKINVVIFPLKLNCYGYWSVTIFKYTLNKDGKLVWIELEKKLKLKKN